MWIPVISPTLFHPGHLRLRPFQMMMLCSIRQIDKKKYSAFIYRVYTRFPLPLGAKLMEPLVHKHALPGDLHMKARVTPTPRPS